VNTSKLPTAIGLAESKMPDLKSTEAAAVATTGRLTKTCSASVSLT
jgi:hypothetical protein